MSELAVYIHWPFCKAKCPYCDFNSHVSEQIAVARWQEAYLKEIAYFAARLKGRKVTSIFFGGGTPSLMPATLVEAILQAVRTQFDTVENVEITLEANPTSIEAARLEAFAKAGVRRISMGIQSLRQKDLQFLGRQHSVEEAKAALKIAAGIFPNYSFDLIYARPGQTLKAWRDELAEGLELAGPHFSLYQLTIEKGTPFYAAHERDEFVLPDEDTAAEMYEATEAMLNAKGMPAYEVSNYAKPGFECRHNLTYWRYGEYVGIGPGAHGRLKTPQGRVATMMQHAPESWLKAVDEKGHGTQTETRLLPDEMREEAVMMGLRMVQGIDAAQFKAETGLDIWQCINREMVNACVKEKLLIANKQNIRTTFDGRLVLSALTGALLRQDDDEDED